MNLLKQKEPDRHIDRSADRSHSRRQAVREISFFSSSVYIFLIRVFGTIANLAVIIYFSHRLSLTEYGLYQNFWVHLSLTSAIAGMGISLFIYTYPPATLLAVYDQLSARSFFKYGAFVAVVGSVFALLQLRDIPGLAYALTAFLFFASYVVSALLESVLIVWRRYRLLLVLNLSYALLFIAVHVAILNSGFRMLQLFLWLLPLLLGRLIVMFSVSRRVVVRSRNRSGENEVDLKRMRTLWLHYGVYDLTNVLFHWLDKFIISFVMAAGVAAVYFNGTVQIPFLPLALSAVGSAVLIHLHDTPDRRGQAALMRRTGRLLSCLAFPAFFFFLFFKEAFILTVFSEKYAEAVPIFLCAIMILPVRAYSNTSILQHYKKAATINIGALLDIGIALLLFYPFYRLWSLPGVALAFVCSTYIQSGFYLYKSRKLLAVPYGELLPIKNWLWKAVGFAALGYGLSAGLLAGYSDIVRLVAGGGVMAAAAMLALIRELRILKKQLRN